MGLALSRADPDRACILEGPLVGGWASGSRGLGLDRGMGIGASFWNLDGPPAGRGGAGATWAHAPA